MLTSETSASWRCVLSGLPSAQRAFELIVLDPAGRVRFSGAHATASLAQGDAICRSGRGVSATNRTGRYALEQLMRCTLADAATGTAAVPRVVPLPRAGRLPLIAIGLPITHSRRHADFELGAVILLRDPEHVQVPPKRLVRDMFGLTVAEADVAVAIASGHALKEVARLRTCSLNTVRTLASRVLEKTGCRRQAEVVRLLGALNDALTAANVLASGTALAVEVGEDRSRRACSLYETLLRLPLNAPPNQHATVVSRTFSPGDDTGFHLHGSGHEVVCVLEGSLTMEYLDRPASATGADEAIYVPPGVIHRGVNADRSSPLSLFHIGIGPAGSIDRRNA